MFVPPSFHPLQLLILGAVVVVASDGEEILDNWLRAVLVEGVLKVDGATLVVSVFGVTCFVTNWRHLCRRCLIVVQVGQS